MNLAQHLNRFYQDLGEPDTNRFPIALVKEWLDEGERVVNEKSKCVFGESIEDAVANQRLYFFPSDILDNKVDSIYFSENGDSDDRKWIVPSTISKIDMFDRLWRTRTGTPKYWYVDYVNNKWGITPYPVTLSGTTNCVRVIYRKKHTKMTRYYTTGTVSISNGSTSVTGSGTVFTGNVAVGDKIGVGALLSTTAFPTTWYTVSSVDSDTGITLTSAFAEATVSGSSYIACADSTITYDELNQSSVLIAMGNAKFKDKEYGMRDALISEAYQRARSKAYEIEKDAASNGIIVPNYTMPSYPMNYHDY